MESWELEHFAQQLLVRFPPCGRFVESELVLSESPMPGHMTISLSVVQAMLPDLKSPNRVRAVNTINSPASRWPQLSLFASFGMHDQVQALLQAGADVDKLDDSGGSALLCAIQHAECGGSRTALNLLLTSRHSVSTLNAMTSAKRLTPLMCAIDLGEPDVVLNLLEQGADADMLALTDHHSPLYYAVTKLFGRIHPQGMCRRLLHAMLSAPDGAMQDALRRFGVVSAGAFGSNTALARREPERAMATVKALVDQHVQRYSVDKLQQILALMLRFGADPNRGHSYPVRGYTPLMLAAESDLPVEFNLMLEHGGDPLKPNAQGHDCMRIARDFGSMKILALLQRRK